MSTPVVSERRISRDVASYVQCSLIEVGACCSRYDRDRKATIRIDSREEGEKEDHTFFLCENCATKLGELP